MAFDFFTRTSTRTHHVIRCRRCRRVHKNIASLAYNFKTERETVSPFTQYDNHWIHGLLYAFREYAKTIFHFVERRGHSETSYIVFNNEQSFELFSPHHMRLQGMSDAETLFALSLWIGKGGVHSANSLFGEICIVNMEWERIRAMITFNWTHVNRKRHRGRFLLFLFAIRKTRRNMIS